MKIDIANDIYEKLNKISEITDTPIDEIVTRAVRGVIGNFSDNNGVFDPKEGIYLKHSNEFERLAAAKEGKHLEIEETPCVILGKHTLLGAPYVKIYLGGNLMSVPAREIKK